MMGYEQLYQGGAARYAYNIRPPINLRDCMKCSSNQFLTAPGPAQDGAHYFFIFLNLKLFDSVCFGWGLGKNVPTNPQKCAH